MEFVRFLIANPALNFRADVLSSDRFLRERADENAWDSTVTMFTTLTIYAFPATNRAFWVTIAH